jgi:hypothetical protein
VRDKFNRNPDLRAKLLATADAYLEEGNTWGDQIWGVYNGQGTNWLGKILMQVRTELRSGRTMELTGTRLALKQAYRVTIDVHERKTDRLPDIGFQLRPFLVF